jgi:hypothetical protein
MSAPTHGRRAMRLDRRRIGAVAAAGCALAAGAVGLAVWLDEPAAGPGARDPSQPIVAGPVVAPTEAPSPASLPPLRLVLDRPPPDGIGSLPPAQQVIRLRRLSRVDPRPQRLVELGSALQATGDGPAARAAYRAALGRAPGSVAARVGLAMVDGATGPRGLARAAGTLGALARQHPSSQLVAFNQGWLAAYRQRPAVSLAAWQRTVSLGPATPLGRSATELVRAVRAAQAGGSP